jgi:RimJ/RimL family protein N-acetyltransferase
MNPLLLDFPNHIETERLLLRVPKPGDGIALNEAICESIAELKVWMPWAQQKPKLDESETVVRQAQVKWIERSELFFFIFDKMGDLMGASSLLRMDWDVPRFEIGYWLRTSAHGQGLMTEAVQGIADFAFRELKAKRVEIHCAAGNVKSAAVAKRSGFEHEATLKNYICRPDGELCDFHIYARTS